MTEMTTEAAPAPIKKKRSLAKVATTGVAVAAGFALAATAFQFTQGGSASYDPTEQEAERTLTLEDIKFRSGHGAISNVNTAGYVAADEFEITLGEVGTAAVPAVLEFDVFNDNPSEYAELSFATTQSSDMTPEQQELFRNIIVRIERVNPAGTEIYEGNLSDLSARYFTFVHPDAAQNIRISSWVDQGYVNETADGADVEQSISTTFTIVYGVRGLTEAEKSNQQDFEDNFPGGFPPQFPPAA